MKKYMMMRSNLKVLSLALKNAGLKKYATDVETLLSGPEILYIFDFDGTLFRSPAKPALWKGGWWGKQESLNPPCVPQVPDSDWWISDVVGKAKEAQNNPKTMSVMMTGRGAEAFSARIDELLSGVGLNFDQVLLSDSYDTVAFKSGEIRKILEQTPSIMEVNIYDDRGSYIEQYKSLISEINPEIVVKSTTVQVSSKGALCDGVAPDEINPPNKTSFIGIFLDSDSKGRLYGMFPTLHDNAFGESIPVIPKPRREQIHQMKEAGLLGKPFKINVVGYVEDDKGQAAIVEVPDASFPDGMIPHIPISTAKGVRQSYISDMINTVEIDPVSGLTLSGIMWWS